MEEIKWGGIINEFLWVCAGANRKVLRQCPTEYAKYAGIGGTILFTAILASISGGYAIYKVFADEVYNASKEMYETDMHAVYIAVAFGIIWGAMIFNLDRFMVNTMYSDGTHKITREEWIGGTPRLILAIFIGVVISTPIELRIFKDKIQAQIIIDQGKAKGKMDNEQQNLANEVRELESQKRANHWRIDSINAERAKIEDMAYAEATGKGGSGVPGVGIYTKQLEARAKSLEKEAGRVQREVERADSTLDHRLNELYRQQNEHGRNNEIAANSMKGFAAELTALNEITFGNNDGEEHTEKENNEKGDFSLSLARIMIMFLFVAIEIIPTLFKLMMIDGPYDAALKAEKHRIQVLSDKRVSDLNDEINTAVLISTETNRKRLETEVSANKELLNRLATVQAELLHTAIEKWREEELVKIKEDPSVYIKSNRG